MADDNNEIVITAKKRGFVGNAHPIVTLKVGGKLYTTWKSSDIQRSIATCWPVAFRWG